MPLPPLVDPVPELADAERIRTARHGALAGLGEIGQRRIGAATVAVVGAGGLGSPAIQALAAAGVGTLIVIDDDTVDASNLQRQIIHRRSDVGAAKVTSAERVSAELSRTRVVARPERLTAANAEALLAHADVVIDGTDTFETRSAVAAACETLGVPLVWGTVQEFDAQVTVFWSTPPPPASPVRLADLHPPESVGEVPTCSQVGVLGPLCLQIGSLLATEAIKLIAGIGEPLLGRVLVVDALRGRWREVPLRAVSPSAADPSTAASPSSADPSPPSPSPSSPSSSLPDPSPPTHAWRGAGDTLEPVPLVHPNDLPAGADVLDVREPDEIARTVLIPGARAIPLAAVLADPAAAASGPVVVVCQAGVRAQRAAEALRAAGVEASVLAGGMDAWAKVSA